MLIVLIGCYWMQQGRHSHADADFEVSDTTSSHDTYYFYVKWLASLMWAVTAGGKNQVATHVLLVALLTMAECPTVCFV